MNLSFDEYKLFLHEDFLSFASAAFYELNPAERLLISPHLELIAAKLEACRLGQIQRLIINVPPRSLKSHLASISFPAWVLGHDPSTHIISACYGQDLSEKFARDCRKLMLTDWYQRLFRTRLSERYAVNDFETSERGSRMATSVEGPITGRGANMIIIDDPLKPADALSQSQRTKTNQWFTNTLLSRLNDKVRGCIIIVMQRLHQDDLVGHVLEQGDWEVVSFPAIAEQDEVHVIESRLGRRTYRRKAGEALHPERDPLNELAKIRRDITEYTFASQYQQTPIPPQGNLVRRDWFKAYEPGAQPAQFSRIVLSWDTANKADDLNDYSVCTVWGVANGFFYLLHVYRERLNFPELKRKVVELAQYWKANSVLIEDKASGTQLIQDLQYKILGLKAYKPPPGTDKIMRLHMQTAVIENGHVYLPTHAPWLNDYVLELTGFPTTKFDDQVDSTTQALAYMRDSNSLEVWAKLGEGYRPHARLAPPRRFPWGGPPFNC